MAFRFDPVFRVTSVLFFVFLSFLTCSASPYPQAQPSVSHTGTNQDSTYRGDNLDPDTNSRLSQIYRRLRTNSDPLTDNYVPRDAKTNRNDPVAADAAVPSRSFKAEYGVQTNMIFRNDEELQRYLQNRMSGNSRSQREDYQLATNRILRNYRHDDDNVHYNSNHNRNIIISNNNNNNDHNYNNVNAHHRANHDAHRTNPVSETTYNKIGTDNNNRFPYW